MKAMLLSHPGPAEQSPLELTDLPTPTPGDDEVLVLVHTCGICHTDLHTVEGEISGKLPVVPGHQIVGVVEKIGRSAGLFQIGDRVGVPWLHRTCGECEFCRSDRENLCERAQFTGFHVNGGYAEYAVVPTVFAVGIPDGFNDAHAAPLLCAGIIGYRALRLSNVRRQQTLGLYGFGASAHIAIQIAIRWGCEVFVATRATEHQRLAKELGATWVGHAEDVPSGALHAAVIFAPAGLLVPEALRALRKGGTLALAGIYMTPIPEMKYERLYHERVVRSVANATRDDARQLMQLAGEIPIRTEVQTFPLADANRALLALKQSEIHGAGVLIIDR
ncbi:MAG TPA: zinc-dependent alcohol dehydrogenase family protein [Verrucomicrobiae bacterium]|nr:zinc-dependent alcohol dehydrogenase family protein [Verrucomicrobiae bacterium]